LFPGITVLGNQIAGISCQHDIFDFPLASRAKIDHFADVSKMVFDAVFSVITGSFCFLNYLLKVSPLGIVKQGLNVSGVPKFDAVFVVDVVFERL
jgi:hypothetical protein